ncbi:MAG: S26 family signal peptidase [Planctomycetia bacterium]|nr:S26 family signal peptidase [Planctomycetia bacterium]
MNRVATCVVASVVVILCGLAVLAPPSRYEVDGLSMAPGLRPGDVVTTSWFPSLDRLRQPRRHERWILTSPDGSPAIKRVVGLPGETISIQGGDLTIGGQTVLTPPSLLAEVASAVPEATIVTASDEAAGSRWQRSVSLSSVLDDAAFAPEERRMLFPVRDVGLAAVVRLPESLADHAAVRVLARVGGFVVPWRLKASGRYAVVAGRLDGHVVGVVWPIADADARQEHARFCLPPLAPMAWDVIRPWPDNVTSDADETPPSLGLGLTSAGSPMSCGDADAMIEQMAVWRDILHRPAADGLVEWRLGSHAFFVLGDFPSGSRDSRHWGPLGRSVFCNRAQPLD